MQIICTSLQTPHQYLTTQFLQAGCPSCCPTNNVKVLLLKRNIFPSVLWHCWLGVRKSTWPAKVEWCEPKKCCMCRFGKTRLKFARFTWFFCKYWAYLCNIYTIIFGSTRRLQMPNFYNVIMFTNKHRFNLTSFFEFVSAFFQTGITNEVEITRPNALKRQ